MRRRELTSGNLPCMFTLRLLEAGPRNALVVELCWFAPGVQVLGIVSRLVDGNDATCHMPSDRYLEFLEATQDLHPEPGSWDSDTCDWIDV